MKAGWISLLLIVPAMAFATGNEGLQPCPDTPNCVSSLAANEDQYVRPLAFADTPGEAWARLKESVSQLKRARVVTDERPYLHVEVRSAVFRFTDDLEFRLDPEGQWIDVRSASRMGHSDLGTNRRRVDQVRAIFSALETPPGS